MKDLRIVEDMSRTTGEHRLKTGMLFWIRKMNWWFEFLSCNYDYPEGISSKQKKFFITGSGGTLDGQKAVWIGDFKPLDNISIGSGVLLLEFEINKDALINDELEIVVDIARGGNTCKINISNESFW